MFGYIRRHPKRLTLSSSIPTEIICLCLSFYLEQFEVLRFSTKYKSKNIKLRDKRRLLTLRETKHCYAICDVDPVKKGKHCWRFHVRSNFLHFIL